MVRINTFKVNQRRNTPEVIAQFDALDNKSSLTFIVLNITEFYRSIIEQLLSLLLNASQFIEITQQQIGIIMHSRKSLLFSEGKTSCKKTYKRNIFEVSMGSYNCSV